ncbi:MAG: hypothetical protein ABJF10_23390 [Chthoniobacter sp.]|uniref:hypothetical protein n=1 Tax=Chthoniobacter sp. TaxID=2510640 RepID=UPI0032A5ED1E
MLTRKKRRTDVIQGRFSCPHCESEQPCTRFVQLGGNQHEGDFVVCATCGGRQRGEDYRYNAATGIFDPVLWDCPYCKALNPNNTYWCRSCHKSLV